MAFTNDTYYDKLIQSTHWRKLRNAYLKAHPICEYCHEHLATEVHHIEPLDKFRNDYPTMKNMCYNEDNLMAVDHECHIKLHKELGKFSNRHQNVKSLTEERLKRFKENYF